MHRTKENASMKLNCIIFLMSRGYQGIQPHEYDFAVTYSSNTDTSFRIKLVCSCGGSYTHVLLELIAMVIN